MRSDLLQSQTISYIRFPLILGIVFAHAHFSKYVLIPEMVDRNILYYYIQYTLSFVIGRQGTPLFAFISGFLFFLHNNLSFSEYKVKLYKRMNSLLIPYLLWNSMVIFMFFIFQNNPLCHSFFSGNHSFVLNPSLSVFFSLYWNAFEGMPVNYQFWFVRDLMIVILLSPLIKLLIVKLKYWGVILLGLFWIFQNDLNVIEFNMRALFFFTVGAYFAS